MQNDLVDRYGLLIYPIVLGSGKRLFRDGSPKTPIRLIDSQTSKSGVLIVSYEPER
jgi:dihydrofolate reductase